MVVRAACALSWLLVGCHGSASGGATPPSGGGAGENARDEACSPAKLGLGASAKALPQFRLPEGCRPSGVASVTPPSAIRSDDEFERAFTCAAARASGVDFSSQDLWVSVRQLSPAQTGIEVVDDGQKVTLVSQFRAPCPNDFPPMPITYPVAFVLPHGAERAFAEAACTFSQNCPR